MGAEELVIPLRFRGPPMCGNGGYVAGRMAELLGAEGPVEVTLRSMVPLDKPLSVERGEVLRLVDGETLLVEARAAELDLEVPAPPSFEQAKAVESKSLSFISRQGNPRSPKGTGVHPVCYCCGVDNPDGLQVHAAPLDDGQQVAAAWQTRAAWGDADGNLPARMLWTALDCPGQFAFSAAGIRTGLLGRITGEVLAPAPAGQPYVVTGFRIGIERKKHFAGTALFDAAGQLIARARATWIGAHRPEG